MLTGHTAIQLSTAIFQRGGGWHLPLLLIARQLISDLESGILIHFSLRLLVFMRPDSLFIESNCLPLGRLARRHGH
jgi:hypothetical protein